MYSFLQIVVQKIETINNIKNSHDLINKSCHVLIRCLNTIGNQQEILDTKVFNYLLNLLNCIIDYMISYTYHGIVYQHG
jgi:hypothetical protein